MLRWNPQIDKHRIRIGQELQIYTELPESNSESIGSPNRGKLIHGLRLTPHAGYVIRDRDRAWGTLETITNLRAAFSRVTRRYPKAPQVMVHDISRSSGGWMDGHRSHQSGRDVDIAYYLKKCEERLCRFHRIGGAQLDLERQWALLEYWLRHGMVEAIFIDYKIQKYLYRYAKKRGASREELFEWFQYPRGRDDPSGVIRHFPKHDDHIHVRFVCHETDEQCRSFRPYITGDREELHALND